MLGAHTRNCPATVLALDSRMHVRASVDNSIHLIAPASEKNRPTRVECRIFALTLEEILVDAVWGSPSDL